MHLIKKIAVFGSILVVYTTIHFRNIYIIQFVFLIYPLAICLILFVHFFDIMHSLSYKIGDDVKVLFTTTLSLFF